jgi:superfamily II RNA helicase
MSSAAEIVTDETEGTPNLAERIPDGEVDSDTLLDIFIEWTLDQGYLLYEAQEEAVLEVFAGNHVVLNTPTGSGKSLVALAMHFHSFATGKRSYYTSPIKALVSEKFFDLCKHFGAENVGMFTGDASINKGAPIVCCTQEILASIALSDSDDDEIHHAIVDEFHYYADRDRGISWQLPLLTMTDTIFMLMSATLGNPKQVANRLEDRSGRDVGIVRSNERPVPLEFKYSTDILVHTVQDLVDRGLAPVYVVNFSQRECADLAQSMMSLKFCSKEEKRQLKKELKGVEFDTPYGDTMKRYLRHGHAVHHGGLLPKYRRTVERLAQKGLLKVVSGTDTLGVGINLPLRTVVFSKLCKYDGREVRLLTVRDFKQIAGRAGRKGYDDKGLVVCQAPEHVIENLKIEEKIKEDPSKAKKLQKSSPPDKGYVHWDEETFFRLASSDSEQLESRFTVNHAILLDLLQRPDEAGCGYRALIELIALSHESDGNKSRLRRKARMLFQSLRKAGILEVVPRSDGRRGQEVQLAGELQDDFSIYHSLSLFLVDAAGRLDPEDEEYHLKLLSFVEAILEDPRVVLFQQRNKLRTEAYRKMKAEGVEYAERQEKLEKISWPMPHAEDIAVAFYEFAEKHPWVKGFEPKPKSVARDMYERYVSFNEYIKRYGLERSEGVLMRHLSQAYKTLRQNVPQNLKTEKVHDVIAYLREVIARTDSSLFEEWAQMRDGVDLDVELVEEEPEALDADPTAFRARVRAELRSVVSALAADDLEEAAGLLRAADDATWTPRRLEKALEPFYEEYDHIVWNHRARATDLIQIDREGPGLWRVTQVLCDPEGDNMWYLGGRVDVPEPTESADTMRLFTLERIDN